jgi:hypothetical protein
MSTLQIKSNNTSYDKLKSNRFLTAARALKDI